MRWSSVDVRKKNVNIKPEQIYLWGIRIILVSVFLALRPLYFIYIYIYKNEKLQKYKVESKHIEAP